jgi:hypothetical protein
MAAARDPANDHQSRPACHGQPAARFKAMRPCPQVLKARASDEGRHDRRAIDSEALTVCARGPGHHA